MQDSKRKSEPRAGGGAGGRPERLTSDLLEELLASSSIENYLSEPDVAEHRLTEYLKELLKVHGIRRADVVHSSGINSTFVYDIFTGKSKPGRDRAIMLAFGLGCDLSQTQRLLRLCQASELWCKRRRDAIIIWCIEHGLTRAQADDELYRLGEHTLLGTDRLDPAHQA